MSLFEKTGRGADWLIRGQAIVQILASLGGARMLAWLATTYGHLPPGLATAVWLLVTAAIMWVLLVVFKQRTIVQKNSQIQTVDPQALEQGLKATDEFYKFNSGPMLQEVEQRIEMLAAQHKNATEREKWLLRTLSAAVLSYMYDTIWFTIYRSQLEALLELNRRGVLNVNEVKPFYDAAVAAYPRAYKNYTLDSWLNYLRTQVLIVETGVNVQVSTRGKDFLKYLVQCGRSEKNREY